MIPKNLGIIERIIRLIIGVIVGFWAFSQASFGWIEGIALVAALFLVMNAVFSRCYLWQLLGFNTCDEDDEDCNRQPAC